MSNILKHIIESRDEQRYAITDIWIQAIQHNRMEIFFSGTTTNIQLTLENSNWVNMIANANDDTDYTASGYGKDYVYHFFPFILFIFTQFRPIC